MSPDIEGACIRATVVTADEKTIEKMFTRYRTEKSSSIRTLILRRLGLVQSEELIKKVLEFGFGPDVPEEDFYLVAFSVSANMVYIPRNISCFWTNQKLV